MTIAHSESEVILHPTGLSVGAPILVDIPWLRHASTTREFSRPDSPRLAELERIKKHLGAEDSLLVFGEQKHTDHVALVNQDLRQSHQDYFRFQETDAIVCTVANVTIAIMTADCAPVFLVDPVQKFIALAHAGWKGTFARIASKTVQRMISAGSNARDILAWAGPMAGGCCYEVSAELLEKFEIEFPGWPVRTAGRDRNLDLVDINCRQLQDAGLAEANIHRSNLCTIHHSNQFYSYRGDNGTHGRIISAMVMLPQD